MALLADGDSSASGRRFVQREYSGERVDRIRAGGRRGTVLTNRGDEFLKRAEKAIIFARCRAHLLFFGCDFESFAGGELERAGRAVHSRLPAAEHDLRLRFMLNDGTQRAIFKLQRSNQTIFDLDGMRQRAAGGGDLADSFPREPDE